MLDLALIQPPTTQHGDETTAAGLLVILLVLLGACVLWAVRKREPLLIALLVGAGLAGFVEVQLDVLARISWATNLPAAYEFFDRRIPLFVPFTYALVIGGGMYVGYRLCVRGATRRQIIGVTLAFAVAESAFEMITMNATNFWTYYGPQPLEVFGFPLYWGVINAVGAISTGVLIYTWRERLEGWGVLQAALIPPLAFGADFAVGWPTWNAMNSSASVEVMSLVSLVTIALCAAELWFVATLAGRRQPVRPPETVGRFSPAAAPTA